jgi:hypothetical protein
MFQYAFGLAAAHQLGTTLNIDDAELRRIFVLGPARDAGEPRPEQVATFANDAYEKPAQVLEHLRDETTYAGYFQSEEFFSSIAEDVRRAFRLRDEHVRAFESRYADLADREYVCCHMRRTDYHTFAGGVALPMSYYESALARIGAPRGMPIVFVGDDLGEARASFGERAGARFEQNDEAVDLQLLGNATTVVASNSSFAWWGAWLNPRADKRVLAPRHWLGYGFGWEYPPHVIPSEWQQLRVKLPWGVRFAPAHLRMSLGRTRRNVVSQLPRR